MSENRESREDGPVESWSPPRRDLLKSQRKGPAEIRSRDWDGDGPFDSSDFDVLVTPHGLNELVWNGNSPGRWDSASWSRPDGTPTTEIPDLNTVTTVASHRVAVDGPAGAVVVAVPAARRRRKPIAERRVSSQCD